MTLVEARPFPAQLRQIAASFQVDSFTSIFRNYELDRNPLASPRRETTPSLNGDAYMSLGFNSNGSSIVSNLQTRTRSEKASTPTSDASDRLRVSKMIFNKNGHRLDSPVRYNKLLLPSLRARQLCMRHFLSRCLSPICGLSHTGSLDQGALDALRHEARLTPCQSAYCADPRCVSGHVCPHRGRCNQGKNCKFPIDMHNVEKKIDPARTLEILI